MDVRRSACWTADWRRCKTVPGNSWKSLRDLSRDLVHQKQEWKDPNDFNETHFLFIPKKYGEKSDLPRDPSQMDLKQIQPNMGHLIEHWSPDGPLEEGTQMSISAGSPSRTPSTQCRKTAGSLKAQPEIFSKPHVSFIHFNRKRRGTREIPFIFSSSCAERVWLNPARLRCRGSSLFTANRAI